MSKTARIPILRPLLPDEQAALAAWAHAAPRPWAVVTVGGVTRPRLQIVDSRLIYVLGLAPADLGLALLIVSAVNAWAPPPPPAPVAPDSDLPLIAALTLDGAAAPSYTATEDRPHGP